MNYNAKIVLDSIAPNGSRLTTFELTLPKFILAELNTHRVACLAGDSILEFDLPAGHSRNRNHRRIHKITIADFVDKWNNGAARTSANPKKAFPLDWIDVDSYYSSQYIADSFGMPFNDSVNQACREGKLKAIRGSDGRTWMAKGSDIISWRMSKPKHTRFSILDRLKSMQIRQLNETTGDIQLSTVKNAFFSGKKDVYEVTAGNYKVAGSKDHRILTVNGWKTIEQLTEDDFLIVRKYGKKDKLKSNRFAYISNVWRSSWQLKQKTKLKKLDDRCRVCKIYEGVDIHHIIPVYIDASKALDESNITLLCENCHKLAHKSQGWQSGFSLYGAQVKVTSIKFRGFEDTYDLEIAGEFPNFLANGITVHNSKSTASSRAIPTSKIIEQVLNSPVIPAFIGKNKSGMQAVEEVIGSERQEFLDSWLSARDYAVDHAQKMLKLGIHKQVVNRLLEPWMWAKVIFSSTHYDNFFRLRANKMAQPEFRVVAEKMLELYITNKPKELGYGQWHMPYIDDLDSSLSDEIKCKVSSARCARVSYLNHLGVRDIEKDLELYDRLVKEMHCSPLEQVATPCDGSWGNFTGWKQFRKVIFPEFEG